MSALLALTPDQFGEFFDALWGYDPFPWQEEFARRLCVGEAPDYVTVPTGSGKTACLDAAVFSLAVQSFLPVERRTVGRRIFFIVNRRIIVDEAFDRAKNTLVEKLSSPGATGILARVAAALRSIGGQQPLACAELRGGIYRDRAWAKSIVQPMILCGTVDQVGSRLLFRGYGVSDEARPIHAALIAQDSLLIIDEAHISQPFLQTLDWVKRYRAHRPAGAETVALPFSVVRLTATPLQGGDVTKLELSDKDREHETLQRRLGAEKKVSLVPASRARGKSVLPEMAKALEQEASGIIAQNPALRSIAVMVNRVATARAVEELLRKKHGGDKTRITLVIGRMRPIDRDKVTKELQDVLKTGKPARSEGLEIVVSTQCLEVGADLDFDAIVSECASLDALRQRFGRLNRGGREITAFGVIVMPEEQSADEAKLDDEKPIDPVYGNAVPRTWRWLEAHSTDRVINFGLNAMTEAVSVARESDEEAFQRMLMPRADAPVLLPAYLDCWAQTNPAPAADPDVALFLHGPQRDMAEVQVCWRADLPEDENLWSETIGLCPPTTLECLPVPLHLTRQWLVKGDDVEDTGGDAPALIPQEADSRKKGSIKLDKVMIWEREGRDVFVGSPRDLRPGHTLILRTQDRGWESLGHVPLEKGAKHSDIDRAEEGIATMRRQALVRVHPSIPWGEVEKDSPEAQLRKWAGDGETEWRSEEVAEVLVAVVESLPKGCDLFKRLDHLRRNRKELIAEPYPDGSGVVLSVRKPFVLDRNDEPEPPDDGPDDPLLDVGQRQTLKAHTAQVVQLARRYVEHMGLGRFREILTSASGLHDIGKADPRFQALLIQGTLGAAYAQSVLWAKSDNIPDSRIGRERARLRAELPQSFRHEMTSVLMAALPGACGSLPEDRTERDLALHLIASHHGHARPFAPIVHDAAPPPIEYSDAEVSLRLGTEHRLASPAHAIDSGIAERFWSLTRLHGWWGLALLEAVLRLADQTASAHPETVSDQ